MSIAKGKSGDNRPLSGEVAERKLFPDAVGQSPIINANRQKPVANWKRLGPKRRDRRSCGSGGLYLFSAVLNN
jgi:hypothetical protein